MLGREISDTERIFARPYRYWSLAIRNPLTTADEEFHASSMITADLTKAIINQEDDVISLNNKSVQLAKNSFRTNKEESLKRILAMFQSEPLCVDTYYF